jgi:diketogulonate reductase-like aldo/keto reductase
MLSERTRATRRDILAGAASAACMASFAGRVAAAQTAEGGIATRTVSTAGEALPVIGLGSWITFNVGDDPAGRQGAARVMRAFFDAGGRLIDSSPMYGSAQEVIGASVASLGARDRLYSATKVWISGKDEGEAQIAQSRELWRVPRFDLLQVHNLVSWEAHLDTLFAMKAAGDLRHVGITTSHGRRHGDIEAIMATHPVDFVQITYNPVDRDVERRILPLAAEKGIGVIVNRPFRGGSLVRGAEGAKLPDFAAEIDCANWAQLLLKFSISHPAVTCAIPATSQVAHLHENMGAGKGRMPDADLRERIASAAAAL